jgi:hypothetical protein
MKPRMPFSLLALLVLLVSFPGLAWSQRLSIEVKVSDQVLEGTPLAWSSKEVLLLGRDGQLWNFSPSAVTTFQKNPHSFASLTSAEFRAQLSREFDRGFDVSGTGHFQIVHPAGQRDRWADRFEQL